MKFSPGGSLGVKTVMTNRWKCTRAQILTPIHLSTLSPLVPFTSMSCALGLFHPLHPFTLCIHVSCSFTICSFYAHVLCPCLVPMSHAHSPSVPMSCALAPFHPLHPCLMSLWPFTLCIHVSWTHAISPFVPFMPMSCALMSFYPLCPYLEPLYPFTLCIHVLHSFTFVLMSCTHVSFPFALCTHILCSCLIPLCPFTLCAHVLCPHAVSPFALFHPLYPVFAPISHALVIFQALCPCLTGAAPAHLLAVSIAASIFWSTYLQTCIRGTQNWYWVCDTSDTTEWAIPASLPTKLESNFCVI